MFTKKVVLIIKKHEQRRIFGKANTATMTDHSAELSLEIIFQELMEEDLLEINPTELLELINEAPLSHAWRIIRPRTHEEKILRFEAKTKHFKGTILITKKPSQALQVITFTGDNQVTVTDTTEDELPLIMEELVIL